MKERFTAEEWELLKFLPMQMFVFVAGADNNIDKKEIAEFNSQFTRAALLKNELHRELMIALMSGGDTGKYLKEAMDMNKTIKSAEIIRPILKEKLGGSEYQDFVRSLFLSALDIARASGGGLFSRSKVSEDEASALGLVASIYDVDMSFLKS